MHLKEFDTATTRRVWCVCSLVLQVKPLSEEHASVKVKTEPTENKVLRALMRTVTSKYRVTSGKEAIQMLLTSARVKEVCPLSLSLSLFLLHSYNILLTTQ